MRQSIKLIGFVTIFAGFISFLACVKASPKMNEFKKAYQNAGYTVSNGEFSEYTKNIKGVIIIGDITRAQAATIYEFKDEESALKIRDNLEKEGQVEIKGKFALVTISGDENYIKNIFEETLM